MGDRGRLVVPAELRERVGPQEGRDMVFIETRHGVLLLTRDQLRDLVRADLRDKDLVEALLKERRATSHREDAE